MLSSINISESKWNISRFLLLILTSNTYFDSSSTQFYFKSAKVIKLKTLNFSNVKKFYNDLT